MTKARLQRLALPPVDFVVKHGHVFQAIEGAEQRSFGRAVVHDDDPPCRPGAKLIDEAGQRFGRIQGGYDDADHGTHFLGPVALAVVHS